MKFDSVVLEHLNDRKFSNGLFIKICTKEENLISRFKYLENLVRGKNVIHVGCCDHIPLIEKKLAKNTWLHKRIVESANMCIGIDIDSQGIAYMKENLHYENVYCSDITKHILPEIAIKKWDFMILGELLEHIDNPVAFLENIHKLYNDIVTEIIVTVPNAFAYSNLKYLNDGYEIINTDHRYWFTPYTLAKVLTRSNFKVGNYYFVHEFTLKFTWKYLYKIKSLFKTYLQYRRLRNRPVLRDTLLMTATF